MTTCPCGSHRPFAECCEPFLTGTAIPQTAEQLMRSRYSAFVTKSLDYLQQTLTPATQHEFDRKHVEQWASSEWLGLDIVSTEKGTAADDDGWVEFVARFAYDGHPQTHHESSFFRKIDGRWYYESGISGPRPVHKGPKVGRNDPCPCGSGKKYKKCCGAS